MSMIFAAYGLAAVAVAVGLFRLRWGFVLLFLLAAFTRELGTSMILRRLTPFDLALAGVAAIWLWQEWRSAGLGSIARRLLFWAPVLLFIALALVRAIWVPRPDASLVTALVYAELVVVAVLAAAMAEKEPGFIYRSILLCMTFVAVLCVYDFAAMQLKWPTIWEETFRIMGPFKNPNQTGSYFAMGLPLTMGALAAHREVRLPWWLLLGSVGLQAIALLVTFSRTSLLAATGAIILFYFVLLISWWRDPQASGRFPWLQFAVPLVLAGLVGGVILGSATVRDIVVWKAQKTLEALASPDSFTAGILASGLKAWRQHPVFGVGLANFPYVNAVEGTAGYEIHGSYLATLTEMGLAGALLMGFFLFRLGLKPGLALWRGSGPLRPLTAGALAAVAALMATGVWDTFLRKRHFWVMAGVAVVLAGQHLAGRVRQRVAAPPVEHDGLTIQAEPDLEMALLGVEQAGWQSANPYLSPAWIRAWTQHYGQGLEPEVLLVHRDRRLIGYAALGYETRLGCRLYRFLGQGITSYLEPAAASGEEAVVAGAVAAWFRAQPAKLAVAFHDLNSASPAAAAMTAVLQQEGSRIDRYRLYDCPQMELGPDWEQVLQSHRTAKDRAELRRTDRLLQGLGEPEFHLWSDPTEAGELLAMLQELRSLHRLRFRGVLNEMTSDQFWDFLAPIIPDMLGRGLEFATLRVQGRLVCFTITMPWGTRQVGYLTAIDPAFRFLGPGQLLHVQLFQELCERGYRLFDFSKGASAYKEDWADSASHNVRLVWWVRPGLGGLLLRNLHRASTALRLWLRRRRITSWVRTLPQRLQRKRATPVAVVPLAEGAPLPGRWQEPVLPAIASLPTEAQAAIARTIASAPGPWQVALQKRQAILRKEGADPLVVSWS